MTSTVKYTGQLRTLATHKASGAQIITDAPTDNHGKGEQFSPTDLVATALASCMLTVMGIKAGEEVDLEGTVCEVQKIMVSEPRRIGEIKVRLLFPKDKVYTDKQKIIMERIAHTCPVLESLHPDLVKTLEFQWP